MKIQLAEDTYYQFLNAATETEGIGTLSWRHISIDSNSDHKTWKYKG
ncbi:hypothetical protein PM3016_6465 [Paenibacillus mucilaginosus 3016]|uniref:Uncharacterized protein n=2 Tax=Paenibacillus mucilaginosus TaxID=61624 RepID=H6NIM6_9BACL|nr:hypothetical protein PM3016_6465 [Paenibacillus mucilaginosus 3016]